MKMPKIHGIMESMERTRMLIIDILSMRKQDLLERLERGVLYTPNVDHMVRLPLEGRRVCPNGRWRTSTGG
jgi:hypothetical protein